MRLFRHLVVGVGVLVVSLVVVSSAFATSGLLTVTSDTTLTEDHYGNVWFAADSVALDCAGHSVIGPVGWGPWPRVGIAVVGRSHVAIRNCRVERFGHGFSLSTVDSFSLAGNTSAGNEGSGFVFGWVSNGVVSRNVASGNAWHGFGAQTSKDILFMGNAAANNGQNGFVVWTPYPQVSYSTGIRFVGNASTGNGWDGFQLNALADGSTLMLNVARNNTHGFMIGSSFNTLVMNEAVSNRYTGFVAAGWPSPFFQPTVTPAVSNTFKLNLARRNGVYDAADFNAPGANTWLNNLFGTTIGIPVPGSPGSVGARRRVVAGLCDRDSVERGVELAVAAAVESVPLALS